MKMKTNYNLFKLTLYVSLVMVSFVHSQSGSNPPIFTNFQTGRAFTAITADGNNNIWAGTTSQGIFFLNQTQQNPTFSALALGTNPVIGNTRMTSMARDQSGNIWIAHEGINTTGGIGGIEKVNVTTLTVQHFGPGINARGFSGYSEGDGIPTRRVQQIVVDPNNKVWTAHRFHDVTSSPDYIVTPGSISSRMANVDGPFTNYSTWNDWQTRNSGGIMLERLPYPAYTYNPPITVTPDSRTVNAISVDSTFIYISVFGYNDSNGVFNSTGNLVPTTYLKPRIIKYTNEDTPQFVEEYTTQNARFNSQNGIFNSVYAKGNSGVWVTTPIAGNGFSVLKDNVWTNLNSSNFPNIIPAGTIFNTRAIWGNQYGNVFLGTNKGLIVYDGRGSVTEEKSYTLYNQERNGLISNNILAGTSETIVDDSEDELDYKSSQWIATDNGIIRANIGSVPTDDEYATDVAGSTTNQSTNSSQNVNAKRVLAEMERRRILTGGDNSYHQYTIVTEICDKTRAYDANNVCVPCTQEHVYRTMQENSKFQIASPLVMSQDVMPNGFLLDLVDQDFIDINATVNTKTEHIVNASDVFATSSPSVQQKYNNSNSNWIPDLTTLPSAVSFQSYNKNRLYESQNNFNRSFGETIDKIECKNDKTYRLYNSPSFIGGRIIFKPDTYFFCSYPLESVFYDPITMFVYDKTYTIINFTKQGHALDPGMVARSVVEVNNKIFVVTSGTGYHFCQGGLVGNSYANLSRRLNLVEGCIIFKNADIALKKFVNGQN